MNSSIQIKPRKPDIAKEQARDYNLIRRYMQIEDPMTKARPEYMLQPLKVRNTQRHSRAKEFLTSNAINWLMKLKYNIPLIVEGRIRQKQSSKINTFTYAGKVIVFSKKKGGMKRFDAILRPFVTDLWNNGDINKDDLASILGVSVPTAQRLVRAYDLPYKWSMERPYIKNIVRRARKLYWKGWSTLQIGKLLGYNDETIRRWLKLSGVKLRSKGEKNMLIQFYGREDQKVNRKMTARQFAKKIKEMAYEGRLMKDMERELGMYRDGIARRMKLMGVYNVWRKKRQDIRRIESERKADIRRKRQNMLRRVKYSQDSEYRKKMKAYNKRYYDMKKN